MSKVIRRIYGIIMGFVIQIVCMYRWIPLGGREATCLEAFLNILRSDNFRNAAAAIYEGMMADGGAPADDLSVFLFFVFIASLAIVQILGLIYIPFSFFGRGLMFCGVSGLIFCVIPLFSVSELMYMVKDPLQMMGYVGVLLIVEGAVFIGSKLIEQLNEANREAKELRARDRAFRKDRKRRLKFKGRYSSLFYHIIRENCSSRWSDYITFIAAGSIAVSFVIAGFGMWALLKGQELNTILLNFLALSMVISVFLLVNILLFYLKNRMKGYGILLNLGMRRMTLRFYMAVELICCIALSAVFGFLLGNGLLFGLKTLLVKSLGAEVISGALTKRTWILIFVSIGIMFLVSLMFTRDNYYNPETSGTADRTVMAEPIGAKYNILSILAGGAFVYVGIHFFTDRKVGESLLFPGLFFIGCYLLLKSLWGIFLRCKKRMNALSYKNMLTDNYKYYRFKTTFRYMFFLAVMHTVILFVYAKDIAATVTAQEAESLFPYDYVCIANEGDMNDFANLEMEGSVERKTYPMVRVCSPGQSVILVSPGEDLINNQHIGISETTYQKMCEDAGIKPRKFQLSEDGSTVHIIYQQDSGQKAHPINNFLMEENPFLRVGQPTVIESGRSAIVWLNNTRKLYPERIVEGEEFSILTGAVSQGAHENIVVFSDAYMETVMAEEGKELVLLNLTSEEARPKVEETLAAFKGRHAEEESYDADVKAYYDKSEIVPQISRERAMNLEVNIFIIVLFMITGLIMLYMKTVAELEERKKQHTYLALVGMGPKMRHRLIWSEFLSFLGIPLIISTAISAGFLWVTMRLRMFTASETTAYVKAWGKLYVVYVLIQTAEILALGYYTVRKVDKE